MVDTRALDSEWKPMPGTGDAHTCERCGASHEVHATLTHHEWTGTEWTLSGRIVVGVACCRKMAKAGERVGWMDRLNNPRRIGKRAA